MYDSSQKTTVTLFVSNCCKSVKNAAGRPSVDQMSGDICCVFRVNVMTSWARQTAGESADVHLKVKLMDESDGNYMVLFVKIESDDILIKQKWCKHWWFSVCCVSTGHAIKMKTLNFKCGLPEMVCTPIVCPGLNCNSDIWLKKSCYLPVSLFPIPLLKYTFIPYLTSF